MKIFLPAVLLALWLLAWGHVTVANVVSGTALIAVLMLAFPSARSRGPRVRVHPVGLLRLLAYVLMQLAVSNVLVAREIVSRRSRVRTGIVGYHPLQPSDLTLTLMANIIALSPGTMTVDVADDPPVIYVHFLLLSDVETARHTLRRLDQLIIGAVETRITRTSDSTSMGRES